MFKFIVIIFLVLPVPELPQEVLDLMDKGFFKPFPSIPYTPVPEKTRYISPDEEWYYHNGLPSIQVEYPPVPYLPGDNYVPQDVIEFRQQQNQPKRPLQKLNPLRVLGKGILRR